LIREAASGGLSRNRICWNSSVSFDGRLRLREGKRRLLVVLAETFCLLNCLIREAASGGLSRNRICWNSSVSFDGRLRLREGKRQPRIVLAETFCLHNCLIREAASGGGGYFTTEDK
jgi:hypothetical protein